MSKLNYTWNGGFDLAGKTFGRLYVARLLKIENRKKIWECVCVCGSIHKATTGALNAGLKSCGCMNRGETASTANTVADFWGRCSKSDSCWEWNGDRDKSGYGRFWFRGKGWRCHRLAWTISHGPIPARLCVLHRCDNPPCINPSHLFIGTLLDNNRDKVRKERENVREGSRHANSKLTERQVEEIRERVPVEGRSAVASAYGVSYSVVRRIDRGEGWVFRQAEKRTRVPLIPTRIDP